MKKRRKGQWYYDAKAQSIDWNSLSLFDKLQWQRRYPEGRRALATPANISAYGRLDGQLG